MRESKGVIGMTKETNPSLLFVTIMNAEVCNYCGGRIRAMIFRGSGHCSVDCAKGRPHDAKPVGTVMR